MREIKFRYWDGELKQMCNVRAIVWHRNMIANIEVFDSKTMFRNPNMFYEHALLEYTGLKDKNGKEIYEGDLLKVGGVGRLMPVEWWDGSAGFNLAYLEKNTCEVVGNIYERVT